MLGLFAEMEDTSSDAGLPSALDLAGALAEGDREAVLRYLAAGTPVFDVMEASPDPRDAEKWIAGGPSLITDGDWVWRQDLAAYVVAHGVALPYEFIATARSGRPDPVDITEDLFEAVIEIAIWS